MRRSMGVRLARTSRASVEVDQRDPVMLNAACLWTDNRILTEDLCFSAETQAGQA